MEYKRLTFRHKSVVDGTEQIGYTERIAGCYRASDMILERLAELEDKIEQGKLIELPCKIGDTVYSIPFNDDFEIFEHKIKSLRLLFISASKDCRYIENNFAWFGENIFLTREEAEKKLKELQE